MPDSRPRFTQQSLLVLRLFTERPTESFAGADVMKSAGLRSGTLYPILMRFEELGLLESRWEDAKPQDLGRPRKRLYTVTPRGAAMYRTAIRDLLTAALGVQVQKA